MAISIGRVLGVGAVLGLVGYLVWGKRAKAATASATTTPATTPAVAPASVPRTLAPSNPYAPDSWEGAGYDLGYADAARDRTLGKPQDLSPEPPSDAYKSATDPYGLERGYVEGYNAYWKMMTK